MVDISYGTPDWLDSGQGNRKMADSCGKDCYKNGKACVLTSTGICTFYIHKTQENAYRAGRSYYDPKKDECKIRQERINKIVAERKPIRPPNKRIAPAG